jgi:hypothetical protein
MADSSLVVGDLAHSEVRPCAVDTVSLDDHFAGPARIDFVKCDAEAAEPLIIDGAQQLLRHNPGVRLLIEFNPADLQQLVEPAAFLRNLEVLGFAIQRVDEDGEARPRDPVDLLSQPHSELFLERR